VTLYEIATLATPDVAAALVTSVLIVAGPTILIATPWGRLEPVFVIVVEFWSHSKLPPGIWSISKETVPPCGCAP